MNQAEQQSVANDPLDFYKSLTTENRDVERQIISLSLENNVFPESVRYGIFKDVFRGVVKSIGGDMYYFQLPPNQIFHIVKADTETKEWEANRLYKSCPLGVDMIKSKKDDEEEEKEGKAAVGGGGVAELPPASRPEAQEVASQTAQITENHPGSAMGTTPRQDGSSERWHGSGHLERALEPIDPALNPNAWDTNQLLKAWGQILQKSAPHVEKVDPQLRSFMIEVMGKTPGEVDAGRVHLNGMQRAQYNQWLTRSLRGKLNGLEGLLAKSRTRGT